MTTPDNTLRVSWAAVNARRIDRHGLAAPQPDAQLSSVAAAMCGVHAQVLSAAGLSLALRTLGSTRQTVRDALWNERSLVKTFGPRGTVHLLPTDDLPLWTGALTELPASTVRFPEGVRMTAEQTDAVIAAIGDALADAELNVDELTEAIVARAGAWAGDLVMPAFGGFWPRWRQAMDTAAHRGVLCFGPNRGRNVTYTNPHRWLPGFKPMHGAKALAGVLRRYLYAYGPATPQQFARWLGAPPRMAIDLFAANADDLVEVELDDESTWLNADDTDLPDERAQGVRLLPYFDAFVVGSYPRPLLYPGIAAERALTGGQAGNFPVVLIDGIVAGVWHQRRSGKKIALTVETFEPLKAAQRRDLDIEVERIGTILQGTPTLTLGSVNVGPHA